MSADEQLSRQASLNNWPDQELLAVQSKGLAQGTIERIIELVEDDILRPGDKLPSEKQLMRAFRVGRSSVREALRSLVAMQILESHPGKGYFVSQIAPSIAAISGARSGLTKEADISAMMEAREQLEITMTRLAIARATKEEMDRIVGIGAELREAVAGDCEMLPYTMRVHLAIVAASQNPVLLDIFHGFLPWIMAHFEAVKVSRIQDADMHLSLIEAFASRDEKACVAAIQEHQRFWKEAHSTTLQQGCTFRDDSC